MTASAANSQHQVQGRCRDSYRLDGFPTLAHFISQDSEAEIYRRFSEIGARNLLYLQGIVAKLESELRNRDSTDAQNAAGNPAARWSARNMPKDGDDEKGSKERIRIHEKLTIALKEYREALIQEHQVLALKRPSKRPLATFRRYFFANAGDPILGGADGKLLDDPRDLVALAPVDDDRLVNFLRDHFGWCCKDRKRKSQTDLDIYYFSEHRIQFASSTIITILCAILLIGAMTVLSVLNDQSWKVRLGMVALFTSIFAFTIGLLTNARRAEVFGATAAYTAVLVVYVSQGLGPPSKA